jgi:hypothetical protein
LSYYPTIPLPGRYPKERKSIYKRGTWIPRLIAALLTIAEEESVEAPYNQWMDKEYIIYMYKYAHT